MIRYIIAISMIVVIGFLAGGLLRMPDEARVRHLVLDTIRENPSIVTEAVTILQSQEAERESQRREAFLTEQRNILENDPNAPILGNPDGDVSIIAFFDYNCPFCRQAKPILEQLIAEDPGIRIVARELPVLGDQSVFAARAALASRQQDRYEDFHWLMMGMTGRAHDESVMEMAMLLGLDEDRLRADMDAAEIDAHLDVSRNMAEIVGFNGTPSFIIGTTLIPGLPDPDELREIIAQTRAEQDAS